MKKLHIICLSIIIAIGCHRYVAYDDPIPAHDELKIVSKMLNEDRIINVWMPPSYQNSTNNFPVLYMPDGGIKEDFPHIANTLSKLITEKKIPPHILVGIENTERGRDLTGFSTAEYDKQFCPQTDGAKNFRAFITEELMPKINAKYRTNSKKGIIGESLAGLFIMETFLLHPNTFDFYMAMDPSLWWNNHYLCRQADSVLNQFSKRDLKLWFAGSGVKDISEYTKLIELSLKNHAPSSLNWNYSDEPKEKHHTIFRATKEKAMIWTLNN